MALASGERALDAVENASGLLPDSKAFLTVTFDPMHDKPVRVQGIPDQCAQKTVVLEVKRSLPYTATPLLGAPTEKTVQCRVDLLPLWKNNFYASGVQYNRMEATGVAHPRPGDPRDSQVAIINCGDATVDHTRRLYPLTIATSATTFPAGHPQAGQDVPVYPNIDSGNWGDLADPGTELSLLETQGLEPGDNFIRGGPVRIVAAGFEVINTTPEIYQNGTITSYRQPDQYNKSPVSLVVDQSSLDGTPPGVMIASGWRDNFRRFTTPPPDVNSAMLLLGSQQWEAKKGAYVTAVLNAERMSDFWAMSNQIPLYGSGCESPNPDGSNHMGILYPIATKFFVGDPTVQSPTDLSDWNEQLVGHNAIETCGVLITGISNGVDGTIPTTLTINVKWVIEKIPSFAENLIVIATMSAPFDPAAIILYQQLAQRLPTGCASEMNPLGEWFSIVMHMLRDIARPVGRAIGALAGAADIGETIGANVSRTITNLGGKRKR